MGASRWLWQKGVMVVENDGPGKQAGSPGHLSDAGK
jgi:hypothetical protein